MQNYPAETLWSSPFHSAFTDLCDFKQQLYCCFREATNHVSNDGKIIVLRLNSDSKVEQVFRLAMPNCDLRDPKLSVMPDGKLLLIAYGRQHNEQGNWQYSQPVCWFSVDGNSWSAQRNFGDKNWWVWQLRWYKNEAFGLAYHRASESLSLYRGNPLRRFTVSKANALGLQSHGLGYPNESDMCFTENGTAYAIVRRDADSFTAQLGVAKWPCQHWRWHDLGVYIGCPAIHLLNDNELLVAGRIWVANRPKTALLKVHLQRHTTDLLCTFDSAGDNSYPGMVVVNDDVYLSYYSSHQGQRCDIYLSQISLSDIIE